MDPEMTSRAVKSVKGVRSVDFWLLKSQKAKLKSLNKLANFAFACISIETLNGPEMPWTYNA